MFGQTKALDKCYIFLIYNTVDDLDSARHSFLLPLFFLSFICLLAWAEGGVERRQLSPRPASAHAFAAGHLNRSRERQRPAAGKGEEVEDRERLGDLNSAKRGYAAEARS